MLVPYSPAIPPTIVLSGVVVKILLANNSLDNIGANLVTLTALEMIEGANTNAPAVIAEVTGFFIIPVDSPKVYSS